MTHLSAGDVAKFILSIHAAVMQCVKSEGVEGEDGKKGSRDGGDREDEEEMDSNEGEGESDEGWSVRERERERERENIYFCFPLVGSDDCEDKKTGIAEGGWTEENADLSTQLNKDLESESGE